MLNINDIKSQTGLEALTDEQLKTIADLANNTIKSEVATEKGKVFGRFDADIEQLTGIPKEGATPTHVYLKTAFSKKLEETGKDPEIEKQINQLAEENKELKAKIKQGDSSGILKEELQKKEALIAQLREDQKTAVSEWEKKLNEQSQKYQSTLVDNKFNEALAALKFKDEALIPTAARNAFISSVKSEILSKYKPSFTESGELEFLDQNGEIVRNADNARHPYTAKEMLSKGLESILDNGRELSGGGAKGGDKKKPTINLADARTQVEADELISQQLMQQGLAKGTPEFMAKHHEIRTAAKVTEKPIS